MDSTSSSIAPHIGSTSAARLAEDASAAARAGGAPQAVAHKFESLFATLLVKEMRKTVPDGFFGAGSDGDIYGGWLDQHLGEAIAKRGALNVAPMVERSLERKQSEDGA